MQLNLAHVISNLGVTVCVTIAHQIFGASMWVHRCSMPGYITKLLQHFLHPIPKKPENRPHYHVQPQYGTKVQLTDPRDKTPLLQPDDITKLQQIIGDLLYYARALDDTLMATLNEMASVEYQGTQETMQATKKPMEYFHTHSESKIISCGIQM